MSEAEQVTTNVTDLIRELAEKMGTTVEHLWPTLVQYTQAKALVDVGIGIFILLIAVALGLYGGIWLKKESRKAPIDRNEAVWAVLLAAIGALLAAVSIMGISLPAVFSPEGAALQALIK